MTVTSTVNDNTHILQTAHIAPVVLALLLKKNGISVPAGSLHQACENAQVEGASLRPAARLTNIMNGLQKKNLQVAQLRWDRMDRRQLPALVWHNEQWNYVDHGEEDTVLLTNANSETVLLPADKLEAAPVLWLRLSVAEPGATELLQSGASRLLLEEVFKSKRWLLEVLVATIVVNILAVMTSLFTMQVYDRVVPTFAYATLIALVAGMVIMVILDWSLKFLRSRILDSVAKQVDLSVSQRLYEHVLRLRLDARPRTLGSLAAQMNGLELVRNFFSSSIVFTMADIPFCLMFIGLIGVIGGKVSFVYMVLLPVSLALGWIAQRRLRELARNEVQRGHERHGLLVDTIQGAETIQATGGGWRFADAWRNISKTMADYSLRSKLISSTTTTTTGSLGTIAYVSAIVVGVTQIEAGNLTMGGLIACTILGSRVINPVAQSVQLLVQWQHVRESLNMVNRLLDIEPDRSKDQDLLIPESLPDSLELKEVRFAYPTSPIMRLNIPKMSFTAGERVVVLGVNGCGKTTLLKVLAGLFKPSEGQVSLGGADLWELDPQIVNERVGYLPQDIHLFKGTLKSNMALSGGISDASLLNVAKLLNIDMIAADNPRSMELEISEGGQGLSGGQRQLVGLSRIFLARPRVWLLDEPTASLDNDTESKLMEVIQQRARPTDIIVIATHRPRIATWASRVIVMQRGQIIADGKPQDVLQTQAGMRRKNLRASTES